MNNKWDERYSQEAFAYGEEPNAFLKEQLHGLTAGTILFPAEGEGRNAVYAATAGWEVFAFDQSGEGQKKAQLLAQKHGVYIDYIVNDSWDLPYKPEQFDAIALIYAHFPADKKSAFHKALTHYLRPGGMLLFEAFSKKNLEYVARDERIGGPKERDMLFSVEEIKEDFPDFEILLLAETEVVLHEGQFHNGTGCVIRFIGRKK